MFSHGRMLKKYQNDPLIMQHVSKYFYSEEVYNDASDQPRLRWRYRNFFNDSYPDTSNQNKTALKTPDQNMNRKPARVSLLSPFTNLENALNLIYLLRHIFTNKIPLT